jgi:hypothetical protein
MYMKWYPVPGFPTIEVNDVAEFRNPRTGKARKKTYKEKRLNSVPRAKLNIHNGDGTRATVAVARLVLMAKLGRQLEPWEDACHLNGDPADDRMENLEAKSRLRNITDEYKFGRLPELPNDEIDKAIAEWQALKK